jgi:hypothetical protein
MLANICIQYFFPDRAQVREILPAVRPCTWHSKVQQIIHILPHLSELMSLAGQHSQ